MEGTSELVRLDDRTQKRIWWPERVAEHAGEQLSPNAALGEFDGMSIILWSVTRGEADVAISLRCQKDERTAALDEAYATAITAWEKDARGNRHPPPPPGMPGESLMDVPVVLGDDLGTRYAITGDVAPARVASGRSS